MILRPYNRRQEVLQKIWIQLVGACNWNLEAFALDSPDPINCTTTLSQLHVKKLTALFHAILIAGCSKNNWYLDIVLCTPLQYILLSLYLRNSKKRLGMIKLVGRSVRGKGTSITGANRTGTLWEVGFPRWWEDEI